MIKNKLKIYNTLSGRKEALKPIKDKRINFFVCGPTVYDFSHIGHARTYIIFDCFVKYLRQMGFRVFYLQNITDVDDKIIARAREKGVSPKKLAKVFLKEHLKNMKALRVDSVTKYAKATNYIKEIINQINRLANKDYAYKLEDGIYFNISKFKNYGKLSGRTVLQAEDAVSRIDYSKYKKNRGDFCLWKFSDNGEPNWPSPFGKGRPGWHIEDTAIAEKFFGSRYDIHGGASDLIFPHHEAEIAQMESISSKGPMARYWMHTGFLTIDGQKMSKSLNNFITINDFLKNHSFEHLRFWIAKNLWHAPINYSESAIIEAMSGLERIEEFIRRIKNIKTKKHKNDYRKISKKIILIKAKNDFYKHLNDNFNTPKAFASVFDFIKNINKNKKLIFKEEADEIYDFFEEINKIFGIVDFKKLKQSGVPEEVKKLVKIRENYRKKMEWEKADKIRDEIAKYGYLVEDTEKEPLLKRIY